MALRSIGSVLFGYAVFALSAVFLFQSTHRDPHAAQNVGFIVFAVVYGMVFASAGGLLTAKLAPARAVFHAALMSIVIVLGATASLVARPGAGATWSQWTAITLMAPSAWAAAWLVQIWRSKRSLRRAY
jgi:hypothetical protein